MALNETKQKQLNKSTFDLQYCRISDDHLSSITIDMVKIVTRVTISLLYSCRVQHLTSNYIDGVRKMMIV